MTQTEMLYALDRLDKAIARLQHALLNVEDDLDRDGVIQRFEFTFELLWKTIKLFLEYEGFQCKSPRSCLKEAVKRGYITQGEALLDMLADRNQTSHTYDEAIAYKIYQRIRDQHAVLIVDTGRSLRAHVS